MMRGNGIQALPSRIGFAFAALGFAFTHHAEGFTSVVSFHFRFVYKVTLLRRLVELHLHSGCGFCPAIAPRLVFVLMRFPASQMRFLSENDFGMPRERKWLINDSCAFSDET